MTPNEPQHEEPNPAPDEQGPAVDTGATGNDAGQRIGVLETELAQAKDQMLRAMAEADNTRKRLLREREDIRKYAVAEFARDMLGFADNFRRALESIPAEARENDERIRSVMTGVETMETQLRATLERHGIKKVEPLGEPFNANFHEALFEAPGTGKPAGTVIQIIEPGYMLHDRLLRPARVGIAKDEGQGGPAGEPGGKIDTQA